MYYYYLFVKRCFSDPAFIPALIIKLLNAVPSFLLPQKTAKKQKSIISVIAAKKLDKICNWNILIIFLLLTGFHKNPKKKVCETVGNWEIPKLAQKTKTQIKIVTFNISSLNERLYKPRYNLLTKSLAEKKIVQATSREVC